MKALVVYDSIFGNTKKVARAIGDALGSKDSVKIYQASVAKPEQVKGLDLLVVGSPTRKFKATDAVSQFLKAIPSGALAGVKVAAFDTRIEAATIKSPLLRWIVKVAGYAAKPMAGRLTKKGGNLAVPPEGFIVTGTEGPLKDGELKRAAEWAKSLAQAR